MNGKLTNSPFRRGPQDTDGWSVASSLDAAKRLRNSGCGVAKLDISELEALGLSLEQTDDDHGLVHGMPPYADPTDVQAYNLASEIADKLLEKAKDNVILDKWKQPLSRAQTVDPPNKG